MNTLAPDHAAAAVAAPLIDAAAAEALPTRSVFSSRLAM